MKWLRIIPLALCFASLMVTLFVTVPLSTKNGRMEGLSIGLQYSSKSLTGNRQAAEAFLDSVLADWGVKDE